MLKQQALLPSERDIRFYEAHGYYISPKIISDEVLDSVLAATQRFYRRQLDEGPPVPPEYLPDGGPYQGSRRHAHSAFRCTALSQLARCPLVAATAARLMGVDEIRLWRDELVYEPSGVTPDTPAPWHRDRADWPHCTSTLISTAWIPFTSVSREMGALRIIPGSHRWRFDGANAPAVSQQDLEQHQTQLAKQGFSIDPVSIELERGQVSFHDCLTLHTNDANTSGRPRQNLVVRLQDGDNRYQRPARTQRDGDYNLVRRDPQGRPDFTDPVYCPTLWREFPPVISPQSYL